MIAADTSTWVAFLEGNSGEDVQLLDRALEDRHVVMVPVVLTELLSDAELPSDVAETISEVPLIEVASGYWQRAGVLRAKVLAKRRKARLGDAASPSFQSLTALSLEGGNTKEPIAVFTFLPDSSSATFHMVWCGTLRRLET